MKKIYLTWFFLAFVLQASLAQQSWHPFPYQDRGYWVADTPHLYKMLHADSYQLNAQQDTLWLIGRAFDPAELGYCGDTVVAYINSIGYPTASMPVYDTLQFQQGGFSLSYAGLELFFQQQLLQGQSYSLPVSGFTNFDAYRITCSLIDTMTYLGAIDSVKTYTVELLQNNQLASGIAQFRFSLSKNAGFVEYTPLSQIVGQSSGQTWRKLGYVRGQQQYGFVGSALDYAFRPCVGDVYLFEFDGRSGGTNYFGVFKDSITAVQNNSWGISYVFNREQTTRSVYQGQYSPWGYNYFSNMRDTVRIDTSKMFALQRDVNIYTIIESPFGPRSDVGPYGGDFSYNQGYTSLNLAVQPFNLMPIADTPRVENHILTASYAGNVYSFNCSFSGIFETYHQGRLEQGLGVTYYYSMCCPPWGEGGSRNLIAYRQCGEVHGNLNRFFTATNSVATPLALELFPNPSSDWLNLKLSQPLEADGTLRIRNSMGQLVLQQALSPIDTQQGARINIAALPQGIYSLELQFGQNEQVVKLFSVQR